MFESAYPDSIKEGRRVVAKNGITVAKNVLAINEALGKLSDKEKPIEDPLVDMAFIFSSWALIEKELERGKQPRAFDIEHLLDISKGINKFFEMILEISQSGDEIAAEKPWGYMLQGKQTKVAPLGKKKPK